MKSSELIADALSAWRPVESAADLAQECFERLDAEELVRLAMRGLSDEFRAALRRKDANGVPLYTSVLTPGADGELARMYKQTALFDENDYHTAVTFYRREARANARVADALIADCRRRLGIQLRFAEGAA